MKSLKIFLFGIIVVTLLSCDSPNITSRLGLENLDTLLMLQKSSSVENVSDYFGKFSNWQAFNKDTGYGGMWVYHAPKNKGARNNYVLHISRADFRPAPSYWSVIPIPPIPLDSQFHLYVGFTDDNLRMNYLNQLAKDSSYKLINHDNGYWSFRKGGTCIVLSDYSGKYILEIFLEADILRHPLPRMDEYMELDP